MNQTYKTNIVHRNKMAGKTQWCRTITEAKEKKIFQVGLKNEWGNSDKLFSLQVSGLSPQYVDDKKELNFACFVSSLNEWHGWPANPLRSKGDLPKWQILQKWVDSKYTSRAKAKKLQRLQKKSL